MDDFEKLLDESLQDPEFKKELSELSGVRQSNISRIERGMCIPNIPTLEAIARGLGKKLKIEFV